jgi:hypothetical protein
VTTSQVINETLWREFRAAITKAYRVHANNGSIFTDDFACLRDYAEDVSMVDALAELVDRETENERKHRSNRRAVPGFSSGTAARLILMENARKGAEMGKMPRASAFLVLRQTAVEAEVIGFIIREYLPKPWRDAVAGIDYAKLMKGAA